MADLLLQAKQLEAKMNNSWDIPNDSAAGPLKAAARSLVSAIELKQHPDKLEHLADEIHDKMEQLGKTGTPAMSIGDVQALCDGYRRLSEEFRRL